MTVKKRHRVKDLKLHEISFVTEPAQRHALATIMKADAPLSAEDDGGAFLALVKSIVAATSVTPIEKGKTSVNNHETAINKLASERGITRDKAVSEYLASNPSAYDELNAASFNVSKSVDTAFRTTIPVERTDALRRMRDLVESRMSSFGEDETTAFRKASATAEFARLYGIAESHPASVAYR
ncbi:hypothetical protein IG197_27405 [Aminobacter sp. SR38]|jgi:hypothetical protein|uniref:hypothetical protein n=1 Tax=Aminobacter sp. SR38 TaxID=2774562 RepID=UPI00177C8276|nr:hypothetical protein [Aminobacter sp. SR38]QOF71429.1 hypothetical protein IG197_27405 [Aminobacter sp. SR38]